MSDASTTIGPEAQLVVDDLLIHSRQGVERRLHPGRKLPEPVLEADQTWEGARVYVYGTVNYDADKGIFKMWYLARMGSGFEERCPGLLRQGDVMLYATSPDGIQWEKPHTGQKEFDGSKDNNIVLLNCHSPTIFVDDDAPSEERYRYLGWNWEGEQGYLAAHSSDGLRWVAYPGNPVIPANEVLETMTVARDPKTREFFGYHRRWAKTEKFRTGDTGYYDKRRAIAVTRSPDFLTWSAPSMILTQDEEDDAWARNPQERTEFYNLSGFSYGSQFLGFLPIFRIMSVTPRTSLKNTPAAGEREVDRVSQSLGAEQSPWDGPLEAQLVHSRDGVQWNRFEDRSPIIPRGQPGSFDAGCILAVADRPIIVGNEVWVYYTGINTTHGGPLPPKKVSICRAAWRLDGFVSFEAGSHGGVVETVPVRLQGDRLVLNADASKGSLEVELLSEEGVPLAGYTRSDCETITSDSVRETVRWKQGEEINNAKPLRIRIYLTNAHLYAMLSPNVV
jgi:hypothetical protein